MALHVLAKGPLTAIPSSALSVRTSLDTGIGAVVRCGCGVRGVRGDCAALSVPINALRGILGIGGVIGVAGVSRARVFMHSPDGSPAFPSHMPTSCPLLPSGRACESFRSSPCDPARGSSGQGQLLCHNQSTRTNLSVCFFSCPEKLVVLTTPTHFPATLFEYASRRGALLLHLRQWHNSLGLRCSAPSAAASFSACQ